MVDVYGIHGVGLDTPWENMKKETQQSIEFADRHDTGERIAAVSLLTMEEEEFRALRRRSILATRARKKDAAVELFLTCAFCEVPVYLIHRQLQSSGRPENRHFRHAWRSHCPWHSAADFSPEQIMALKFHGQKEGPVHLALKGAMATALRSDPDTSNVHTERVHLGQALRGEWKKPDVSCDWRGKHLVLELQLSYAFLSEVIKRDRFYQAEGAHILWIFADSSLDRAVVRDEVYYNKRNLFVFDDEARVESKQRGRLVLHCFYQKPERSRSGEVLDQVEDKFVELADLNFDGFRPYFFDYDAARKALPPPPPPAKPSTGRIVVFPQSPPEPPPPRWETAPQPIEPPQEIIWPSGIKLVGPGYRVFLDDLYSYCRKDQPERSDEFTLRSTIAGIPDYEMRQAAAAALKYPFLDALTRLLSIVIGKNLYSAGTIYQMLDAVLQPGADVQRQFAVLYVEVWSTYQPPMSPRHAGRMRGYRRDVLKKLRSGDLTYRPVKGFARLVTHLFPLVDPTVDDYLADRLRPPPVRQPSLQWTPPFDHDKAMKALHDFSRDHRGVDWKKVLNQLHAMYKDRLSLQQAIAYADMAFSLDEKLVKSFLEAASMIGRKPGN